MGYWKWNPPGDALGRSGPETFRGGRLTQSVHFVHGAGPRQALNICVPSGADRITKAKVLPVNKIAPVRHPTGTLCYPAG
ncbi:MAG: hypothetical protein ACJA2K_002311 [Thalassolituus sp.]|jgi:hypothetical protein